MSNSAQIWDRIAQKNTALIETLEGQILSAKIHADKPQVGVSVFSAIEWKFSSLELHDGNHELIMFVQPESYRDLALQLRVAAEAFDAAADAYEHAAELDTVPTAEADATGACDETRQGDVQA